MCVIKIFVELSPGLDHAPGLPDFRANVNFVVGRSSGRSSDGGISVALAGLLVSADLFLTNKLD